MAPVLVRITRQRPTAALDATSNLERLAISQELVHRLSHRCQRDRD